MTSQTETLEGLKLKAKALKIKGAHLCKTVDSLQAKIDEVSGAVMVAEPVEVPKRKRAPRMSVGGILRVPCCALKSSLAGFIAIVLTPRSAASAR